jgi:hypothetical protein
MVLFHYAMLLVAESEADASRAGEKRRQAVELLTLVQTHPATWQVYKVRAVQRSTALRSTAPAISSITYSLPEAAAAILRATS